MESPYCSGKLTRVRRSNTITKPWVWSTCLFGLNSHQDCAAAVPRYEYNNLVYQIDLQDILGAQH